MPKKPFSWLLLLAMALSTYAEEQVRFTAAERLADGQISLALAGAAAPYLHLERSSNLVVWERIATFESAETNTFLDSGAGDRAQAYFRALEETATNLLTGDHVTTDEGSVTIHPVNHASFVLGWAGLTIYNDPVGGAARYSTLPRADLILVSHEHGDHFDAATLTAVRRIDGTNTVIIAPLAVYNRMSGTLKGITTVLTNGANTNFQGASIQAVPAYNANHPRGAGNGYVLAIGGKRFYMSGDTGSTDEMKALENIEVAFLCMNVPFTMSVSAAAEAARAFAPRVVYPYHFRNQNGTFSDLDLFRGEVGTDLGIEVRVRDWY